MSKNQTGQFFCHLWSILTTLHPTHLLAFNLTSSCLGTRHQCHVIIGLGSRIINLSFKSKTIWLNQQLNAMLHANKQALKLIKKSTKRNKDCTSSKNLRITIGNHVLLRDHPEGCNKIQDWYKTDVFVVVGHHMEPNVYYTQLLNKDKPRPPKVVNQHQLFVLNRSSPSVATTSPDGDHAIIPSFLHPKSNIFNVDLHNTPHQYNTRSKRKAATTL